MVLRKLNINSEGKSKHSEE